MPPQPPLDGGTAGHSAASADDGVVTTNAAFDSRNQPVFNSGSAISFDRPSTPTACPQDHTDVPDPSRNPSDLLLTEGVGHSFDNDTTDYDDDTPLAAVMGMWRAHLPGASLGDPQPANTARDEHDVGPPALFPPSGAGAAWGGGATGGVLLSPVQRNLMRSLEAVGVEISKLRNEIEFHTQGPQATLRDTRRGVWIPFLGYDDPPAPAPAACSFDVSAGRVRLRALKEREARICQQLAEASGRELQLQHIQARMDELCERLFEPAAEYFPSEAGLRGHAAYLSAELQKGEVIVSSLSQARNHLRSVLARLSDRVSHPMAYNPGRSSLLLLPAESSFRSASYLIEAMPRLEGLDLLSPGCFDGWKVLCTNMATAPAQATAESLETLIRKMQTTELILREDEERSRVALKRLSSLLGATTDRLQVVRSGILLRALSLRGSPTATAPENSNLASLAIRDRPGQSNTSLPSSTSLSAASSSTTTFQPSLSPSSPSVGAVTVAAAAASAQEGAPPPPTPFSRSTIRRRHSADQISLTRGLAACDTDPDATDADINTPPSYASVVAATAAPPPPPPSPQPPVRSAPLPPPQAQPDAPYRMPASGRLAHAGRRPRRSLDMALAILQQAPPVPDLAPPLSQARPARGSVARQRTPFIRL
ncbi:hypothetical protein HK405_006356 [Cladochytrium tenue]|nr:hypothetical protein HK405_006356 [Cladochytrium tenue]